MYTHRRYGVPVELAGFVKEVGAAVTIAIALAVVIGLVAVNLFPNSSPTTAITSVTSTTSSSSTTASSPTTAITSVTSTTTTVVFSTAAPCGSADVYCGGSQITSSS